MPATSSAVCHWYEPIFGYGIITADERIKLEQLRTEVDRFMLHKAHAAALLRWR